jgi:hypothetical protein
MRPSGGAEAIMLASDCRGDNARASEASSWGVNAREEIVSSAGEREAGEVVEDSSERVGTVGVVEVETSDAEEENRTRVTGLCSADGLVDHRAVAEKPLKRLLPPSVLSSTSPPVRSMPASSATVALDLQSWLTN